MRSIYKYDIVTAPHGIIEGPITKLLTAEVQNNSIVIWAEIDTEKPNRKFQILPIGTGWPLDAPRGKKCVLDTHTYISTVQLAEGALVFHIYGAEVVDNKFKNVNEPAEKTVEQEIKKNRTATFTATNAMINPDILKQFI